MEMLTREFRETQNKVPRERQCEPKALEGFEGQDLSSQRLNLPQAKAWNREVITIPLWESLLATLPTYSYKYKGISGLSHYYSLFTFYFALFKM
jgi:hypothetical protein